MFVLSYDLCYNHKGACIQTRPIIRWYGLLILSRKVADAMSQLSFHSFFHRNLSALQLVKY